MRLTAEELGFIFKLAREQVPAPIPAREPVRPSPLANLDIPSGDDSDWILICRATTSLERICQRYKCHVCPLYRGERAMCLRNIVLRFQRTIERERYTARTANPTEGDVPHA